ncbi:eukaryotic translation initiation factor 4E type 3-like [Halichondria panicea]|uniref:eukaryotic translation initiation factor 4E type 3-like n=1 Tax=Halichondria panicea TaxID=6063 RepID=UPI00312BC8D9
MRTSSPRLSRKAREDAVAVNEPSGGNPDNYLLNSPWTFWHDATRRGATAKDFFENLKPLCIVKTIKAFWGVVNNIRPIEQLDERESYHLMRNENRRPIWEDSDNAHGGLWSFKVRKMHTTKVWQELLLAAVGEQFSECVGGGDCVCGVSVRIRGFDQDIVQIWNEDMPVRARGFHYSLVFCWTGNGPQLYQH